jgi:hypothetical protein
MNEVIHGAHVRTAVNRLENGKPGTAIGPWKSQLSQLELNDLMAYVMTLGK